MLLELQKKYRTYLKEWNLLDPVEALKAHLLRGVFKNSCNVLVAGVSDAPAFFAPFFEKVQPKVLMIAPEEHAPGFDLYGGLIPSYWVNHPPQIPEEQIISCHRSEDQAKALLKLLRDHPPEMASSITLCAPTDRVPLLRDHLEEASLDLHWAGGIPFKNSSLYELLRVTAHFLDRREPHIVSCKALEALLRHPILGRHLPQAETFLKELEDFERKHLATEVDPMSFSSLLEVEKIIALSPAIGTLGNCVKEIKNFLLRILATESTLGGTAEGHYLLGCLKKLLEQLELLEELSLQNHSFPTWTIPKVIHFLLGVLSLETIPEQEKIEALEGVGWLELGADDAPYAILTSCQEGFLPRSNPTHPLLPESLCKVLSLESDTTLLGRDLYLLHVMNASRELKIIAPRYNAREELTRPSRLLTWGCPLEELPKRILTLLEPTPLQESCRSSSLAREASQLQAAPLRKVPIERVTITGLKTYLQSPRLFYLKHLLNLKEILPPPLEMTSSHFGMLLHGVLGAFGKESAMAQEEDVERMAEWLKKKLFAFAPHFLTPALSPVLQLQLQEAAKSLRGFAKVQRAHQLSGWQIVAVEHQVEEKISLPSGRELFLQGRIDRIDWHPLKKRWLLIDYKTSNAQGWEEATPNAMHYQKKGESFLWHDLQLPLYLKLARQLEFLEPLGLPPPTLENTDLCYCQLPLESEKARFSPYFNNEMILPAWKEAERILERILNFEFEEIGKIETKGMPTLAALCGVVGF